MYISDAAGRKSAPPMSPFPIVYRPFTEPVSATTDQTIGPGVSLPDLIRRFYKNANPVMMEGNFSFLDRDNKERAYKPETEDRFVFNGKGSLTNFRRDAHDLIKLLVRDWKKMNLPTKQDKDRKIEVPDEAPLHAILKAGTKHPDYTSLIKQWSAISFILANVDIMKKACIVRTVSVGWWCASYAGKNSAQADFFSLSVAAHEAAFRRLVASPAFKQLEQKLWAEAGDPIYTNPGYPFFAATVDKQGKPVDRINTVELFRDLVRDARGQLRSWDETLAEIDRRAGKYGMRGFPLCVGPLRRLQPGYKYNHQFSITPSGMFTAFDERGINSMRVAWMVPYAYNLLLTPLQVRMKAFRMMLPGLYHDAEAKSFRVKNQSALSRSGSFWIAEADYSNYDRFMPLDIVRKITTVICESTDRSSYWAEAAMHLHDNASLVWPDYSSVATGVGWLFKPGKLGLMSGVKITSEMGTLVNSVVNLEVLARTKGWDLARATDYLCQYTSKKPGSGKEHYYIQSDDSLLVHDDPATLVKCMEIFETAVKAAGLKGETSLADRFLMRGMQGGRDSPVPARVWQNTLSNETPPENELVFCAGLAARSDGMLGLKSVDPFSTGTIQKISGAEINFTLSVIMSLERFVSTATTKSTLALRILTALRNAVPQDVAIAALANPGAMYQCSGSGLSTLSDLRVHVTKLLAEFEIAKAKAGSLEASRTWLYALYRDRFVPSQSMILDELGLVDSSIKDLVREFGAFEHEFFTYASDAIGIKQLPTV